MTNRNIVAFIFARGNSKGIPNKNIRLLAGKPLIAYSIESAKACRLITWVIISTEDAYIAKVAVNHGAEVPFMRPAELAADDSPEWLSWQHALSKVKADVFVSIPTTSPLRLPEDIVTCINLLENSDADLVLTVTPAKRNPYFNMVVLDDDMNAKLAIPSSHRYERRQEAPEIYEITTVAYAARPEFVMSAKSMFDGTTKAVIIPRERALDIDNKADLEYAKFLLEKAVT